jgi:hypothetical protein
MVSREHQPVKGHWKRTLALGFDSPKRTSAIELPCKGKGEARVSDLSPQQQHVIRRQRKLTDSWPGRRAS